MSRILAVAALALALPLLAAADGPPPHPTDAGRRETDRTLREDGTDPAFEAQLRKWREATGRKDDPQFRQRVDRILREDTRRDEGGVLPKRDDREERKPKEPEKKDPEKQPEQETVSSGGGGAGLGSLLWAVLILVAAAVLAMAIYAGINAWLQRSRKLPGSEQVELPATSAASGGAAPPIRREPDEWLAEARRFAAAGRWLDALRCLLFASLERLHRARLVDYERARTNRECVRAFKGPDDRRALFGSLVDAFDGTVYGALPFGAAEYALAESAARELGRGVGDEAGA